MNNHRRSKNTIFFIFLIPLILINFPSVSSYCKNAYLAFVSPLVKGSHAVVQTGGSVMNKLPFSKVLYKENRRLMKKVDELESYLVFMQEIEDENQRLKDLLEFTDTNSHKTIPVQIVGRDADPWKKSLIINKGTKDGLTLDMPVVTLYGLVGVISEVGRSLSKVRLLIGSDFKVSAMTQNSRQEGIVEGNGTSGCAMRYVPKDAGIRKQDIVITSGLGGIFPKGLIIGGIKMIDVSKENLFKKIEIVPSVNFLSLEEALVIIGKD